MRAAVAPVLRLAGAIERLGACGAAGVIAGTIVGFLLTVAEWEHDGKLAPSVAEWAGSLALLAALAWIALVFILAAFLRMQAPTVLAPTFVNAVLTTGLTMILAQLLHAYGLAWLLGPPSGALVGGALCRLARSPQKDVP